MGQSLREELESSTVKNPGSAYVHIHVHICVYTYVCTYTYVQELRFSLVDGMHGQIIQKLCKE